MKLDAPGIEALFLKFATPETELISLDGLTSFLMSADNAPLKDDTDQDMTRPLCEYYIASSHNVRESLTQRCSLQGPDPQLFGRRILSAISCRVIAQSKVTFVHCSRDVAV